MPFSAGTRTSSVSPQKNLESVVTYFKERFSETSQDFVQKEREYLIKAFGNVAYSVGNVASKFVEVMEEQECELSSLDIELRTVSGRLQVVHDVVGAVGFRLQDARRDYVHNTAPVKLCFDAAPPAKPCLDPAPPALCTSKDKGRKKGLHRTIRGSTLKIQSSKRDSAELVAPPPMSSSTQSFAIPPPPTTQTTAAPPPPPQSIAPPPPPSSSLAPSAPSPRPPLQPPSTSTPPPPPPTAVSRTPPPPPAAETSHRSTLPPPPPPRM